MTHPRVDEVAGYLAGTLDAATTERTREHLQGCSSCAATARDLEAVSARLTSVGAEPEPMPAHVVSRIEAALAAEARLRDEADSADAASAASAGSPVTSLDDRRRRRRRLLSGGLLAAAAATVVAVGLGEVLPLGDSDGDAAGSAGVTSLAEEQAGESAEDRGDSGGAASPDATGPEAAPRAGGGGAPEGLRGGSEGLGLRGALVDAIVGAHRPGSTRVERPRCLAAAVDGAPGDGASYAVRLPPSPGQRNGTPAVVWVHPSRDPQQAVLVVCAPEPRVVLRRGLGD